MSQMKDFYEGKYAESTLEADTFTRKERLRYCLPESIEGKTILDIGCGPGVQIPYLAPKNTLIGLDISKHALLRAKKNGYIGLEANLDGCHLPFQDGQFDIVVATDILEHLFGPLEVLQEIRRVLKPNGFALISVPNHFDLGMRWRIFRGKGLLLPWHPQYRIWDYIHLRYFTWKDVQDFMDVGDLKIEHLFAKENPLMFFYELSLVMDPSFVKDWARRHPGQGAKALLLKLASIALRVSLLPRYLMRNLPEWKPTLFARHFFIKVTPK